MKHKPCKHLSSLKSVNLGEQNICEECIKTGSEWVHLRVCQTCGQTLCCDSSPNQHASKHAIESNHPVAASREPGERWVWCYKDEQMMTY